MHYQHPTIITTPTGNNAFSYEQRKQNLGKAEITLPSLKAIHSIKEVKLGNHIVFEEVDHTGKLNSCTGLQHMYELSTIPPIDKRGITPQVFIFDNHNHALYFRARHAADLKQKEQINILHIDQHSDLGKPKTPIDTNKGHDLDYLWNYTNFTCNVGNFIHPFLNLNPQTNFTRIKSETQLLEIETSCILSLESRLFLDIDLDFRAPEMSPQHYDQTIQKTKELITKFSLVTIVTSPYFLDQQLALKIINDILG